VERPVDLAATERPAREGGGSETILLVEDDDRVRALSCEILQEHGYTVLEARHGEDAVDITQRYHGGIHLLLTDVVMPGMGGRELAVRLRPGRPQMRVLYMSGYTADVIVHHGVLDGSEAFLPKPLTPMTLLSKVREALDAEARTTAAKD
jgi:CheY-like chemotaxis protein